jgi:THO complex subunit 4
MRRRRSSGGRAQILGTAPSVSTAARAKAAAAAKVPPSPEKIMVSNLPADVNEQQIKVCYPYACLILVLKPPQELFASTVGPTKTVTLHYDAAGRSKGIAFVVFTKAGDGNKAFQQYNNRLIDGS